MSTRVDGEIAVRALVAAARQFGDHSSIGELAPVACRLAVDVIPDVRAAELVRQLSGPRSMTLARSPDYVDPESRLLTLPVVCELDSLVLRLYFDYPLDEAARRVALLFTAHLATAVQAVHTTAKAANLERALATSRDIGVAMGIIMARRACTRQEAFDLLRRASRTNKRKLAEIAADVADTGILEFELGARDTGTGQLTALAYRA